MEVLAGRPFSAPRPARRGAMAAAAAKLEGTGTPRPAPTPPPPAHGPPPRATRPCPTARAQLRLAAHLPWLPETRVGAAAGLLRGGPAMAARSGRARAGLPWSRRGGPGRPASAAPWASHPRAVRSTPPPPTSAPPPHRRCQRAGQLKVGRGSEPGRGGAARCSVRAEGVLARRACPALLATEQGPRWHPALPPRELEREGEGGRRGRRRHGRAMTRHGRRPERRPELGPRCQGRGNAAQRADPAGGGAPPWRGRRRRTGAARRGRRGEAAAAWS